MIFGHVRTEWGVTRSSSAKDAETVFVELSMRQHDDQTATKGLRESRI